MSVDAALAALGVRVPDLLLPRPDIDLRRWAVVACDQYTSEPDYWQRVEALVADAPSTLRLIYPEAYLEESDGPGRISRINQAMAEYLDSGLLAEHAHTAVLVRRTLADGTTRWGLMVALDLEQYDWRPESTTLIRATEGTIADRIPPRRAIRHAAPLELPHILVLISDGERSVIEPLAARAEQLTSLYRTELMEGGGQVEGWAVADPGDLAGIAAALTTLAGRLDPANPLLFAMGDGNHSLATAKSLWEDIRTTLPADQWDGHPSRYCLVEVENLYDSGLEFEPIHRVLFGLSQAAFEAQLAQYCSAFSFRPGEPIAAVGLLTGEQQFGYLDSERSGSYVVSDPAASIPAGTVQRVIDALVASGQCSVDYVHGEDAATALGSLPGNISLFLPPIPKESLFASIAADGALPRKTFSLGHPADKRYYLEARAIR